MIGAAVAGLVVGGGAVGALLASFLADPEPVPVTLESFPQHLAGLEREDLAAREAGDTGAVDEFNARFAEQRDSFLFAHGGEGATVGYGQRFTLTIVNGHLPLPLPDSDAGGLGNGPPTLISFESETVSCTFQPEVSLYDSAVLDAPADLSAQGETQCLLRDAERNLSLGIRGRVPEGATSGSTDFPIALRRAHDELID